MRKIISLSIMTMESGDLYENVLAERMNSALKEEFGLGGPLPTRYQAYQLEQEAIGLYNNYRPHIALKMKTQQTVHLQKIPAT